jgi:hypothetical protein
MARPGPGCLRCWPLNAVTRKESESYTLTRNMMDIGACRLAYACRMTAARLSSCGRPTAAAARLPQSQFPSSCLPALANEVSHLGQT